MSTRPEPGTPLPWNAHHDEYGDEWWFGGKRGPGQWVIEGPNGDDVAVYGGADATEHNAAYIVYAANKLPELEAERARLVAMLQKTLDVLAFTNQEAPEWYAGEALLAELGEGTDD